MHTWGSKNEDKGTKSERFAGEKEIILETIRKYPTRDSYRQAKNRPSIRRVEFYFGSWTNARKAAGIEKPVIHPTTYIYTDRMVTVYFVSFGEYYKIGITSMSLKRRFDGRPFKVIKKATLPGPEAYEVEQLMQEWLDEQPYISRLKGRPGWDKHKKSGWTECFKIT